jgi:hypothetical protein
MRRYLLGALILSIPAVGRADLSIQVAVDPAAENKAISPYVYGTDQDMDGVTTPGARRYGGNRLTGYNWETNASNAGTDYINESDNYLVYQLPSNEQSIPAIALTSFHDQSLAVGTPFTLLTLQMAGYVSADESGVVSQADTAPSARWDQVVNDKPGGVYLNPPNLTDGKVYMDECLSLLLAKYGPASGPTGVKGYNLDNEPSLWPSTHPRIHPLSTGCDELISKSADLATTIKRMDPSAEVFGGVLYGPEAYFSLQAAPEWPGLQASTGDRWYIDYYLDGMRQASAAAGKRLLDVLDIHRYSDENESGPNPGVLITGQTDFTDTTTDMQRVQDPRSLWDPTYVQNSWIQQYDSQFLPWIPNFQASINAHYPGTRLSFSEYNYGGESDISGGLAQADVLGIYGKYGVYLGAIWLLHSSPPVYVAAAFNLYINYDGQGGKFGSTSVLAADSDTVNSSAYGSVDDNGYLHVVVINKSYTDAANFAFKVSGSTSYTSALAYGFNSQSASLVQMTTAEVANNQLTYNVPPKTAVHFVFQTALVAPYFPVEPASQAVVSGSTVAFTAQATGVAPSGYRWLLNGSPLADGGGISGSASPTLVISAAAAPNAGSYTCTATSARGSTTSLPATLSIVASADPGRLVNVSCRSTVGTGASQLIAGFVVGGGGGSATEPVLVRASGPALVPFGVAGVLSDPNLQLNGPAGTVGSSSGWAGNSGVAATAAAVGAFPWGSAASHDSALVEGLAPGSYTAQVTGAAGDTGIALAEVYDATPAGTYTASSPRLTNISARVPVGTGGNILIAGFVIGGSTAKTVLVRASGPALAPFGVAGTLPDPQLNLFKTNPDGSSTLVATDTGWGGSPQVSLVADAVGAFNWGALGTADSAILATLQPGPYTAQVSGASGDTGIALVEVYEVP